MLDHQTVLFAACDDPQRAPCAPANNPIATYSWDFGDGRTRPARLPPHAYDEAGTYVITLRVSDQLGRSASTTQSVTVSAAAGPTAGVRVLTDRPVDQSAGEFQRRHVHGAARTPAHQLLVGFRRRHLRVRADDVAFVQPAAHLQGRPAP